MNGLISNPKLFVYFSSIHHDGPSFKANIMNIVAQYHYLKNNVSLYKPDEIESNNLYFVFNLQFACGVYLLT